MDKVTSEPLSALRQLLAQLPRRSKRAIMIIADGVAIPICVAGMFWMVGNEASIEPPMIWLGVLLMFSAVPLFTYMGLYRSVVRFMGLDLVVAAFKGVSVLAALAAVFLFNVTEFEVALRMTFGFWVLGLVWVAGSRFTARLFFQAQKLLGDRVIIYGAGAAGARLASTLAGGQGFIPMAYVDDNPSQIGTVINGLEVYSPSQLGRLVVELSVSRVLLAMPSASRRRRKQILNRLEEMPVHVQTVPEISDLISGHARVADIRDVDVADLLGRDAIPPNPELLSACIHQHSVMVTGAGGSIGSELCRQIIRQAPKRIVLLDVSEAALYTVNKELRESHNRDELSVEIIPLIGSVHHRDRMTDVLRAYQVDTLYHAAAYKHVPLVEHNMIEGIHNNAFGTLHTAEAALAAGVKHFVLISTDKAVGPTNVMGATKRLSELILQSFNDRNTDTTFSMVRFGNVLASSGSVVPLFREQIRAGGPVTVTHPEIIRYFMTIPEAAQLVIQAGAMAQGGDVFVLDMGKPVRIKDLAEKMIHLMGQSIRDDDHPDGDVEIVYTGLRPAEKLYEELLIGSNVTGTEHSMIMRAEEDFIPWHELQVLLNDLWKSCTTLDCEKSRQLLLAGVEGYVPTVELEDLVWRQRNRGNPIRANEPAATVTDLKDYRI